MSKKDSVLNKEFWQKDEATMHKDFKDKVWKYVKSAIDFDTINNAEFTKNEYNKFKSGQKLPQKVVNAIEKAIRTQYGDAAKTGYEADIKGKEQEKYQEEQKTAETDITNQRLEALKEISAYKPSEFQYQSDNPYVQALRKSYGQQQAVARQGMVKNLAQAGTLDSGQALRAQTRLNQARQADVANITAQDYLRQAQDWKTQNTINYQQMLNKYNIFGQEQGIQNQQRAIQQQDYQNAQNNYYNQLALLQDQAAQEAQKKILQQQTFWQGLGSVGSLAGGIGTGLGALGLKFK